MGHVQLGARAEAPGQSSLGLGLLALLCAAGLAAADWETVILQNSAPAACLDGSPPGFHIWEEGGDPERWMLHFQVCVCV
jgi:hypothetical protein